MLKCQHYRTLFISDIHLAARGCQAELLLDFLKYNEAETIYLIGDIIDVWRMKKSFFWPQSHNDVIQKLLRKARKGARVFYLPGNHDESFRQFAELQFGGVLIRDEAVHETVDGRRLLVLHGDRYDGVVRHHRWLAMLGESAYHLAFFLNHWVNVARRRLGLSYWSLSAFLKRKVKDAMVYITSYKLVALDDAERRGYDGIVCGHIHLSEIESVDGRIYMNAGDWVENCSALVEHHDGTFEIVRWASLNGEREAVIKPMLAKSA